MFCCLRIRRRRFKTSQNIPDQMQLARTPSAFATFDATKSKQRAFFFFFVFVLFALFFISLFLFFIEFWRQCLVKTPLNHRNR